MSRNISSREWEFEIVRNDAKRKRSDIAENALYVEVLFKKKPLEKPVLSGRALLALLKDTPGLDAPACLELLRQFDERSKRAETLNGIAPMTAAEATTSTTSSATARTSAKTSATSMIMTGGASAAPAAAVTKMPPPLPRGVIRSSKTKLEVKKGPTAPAPAPAPPASSQSSAPALTKKKAAAATGGKDSARASKGPAVQAIPKEKTKPVATLAQKKTSKAAQATVPVPEPVPEPVPQTDKRKATSWTAADKQPQPAKRAKPAPTPAATVSSKGSAAGSRSSSGRPTTRTTCYPTVDELLQYARQEQLHFQGKGLRGAAGVDEYTQVAGACHEMLMSDYSRQHFTGWLEALQLDRNLLVYGAGCKKQLLRRFAQEMLHDEDVLEVSAPRARQEDHIPPEKKKASTSASSGGAQPGMVLAPSEHSVTREHVIWSLFDTIRRHILGGTGLSSAGGGAGTDTAQRRGATAGDDRLRRSTTTLSIYGSSSNSSSGSGAVIGGNGNAAGSSGAASQREMQEQWYRHQEGASVVIEEAVLLSDMLATHYNWKSVAERSCLAAPRPNSSAQGFSSAIDGNEDDEDSMDLDQEQEGRRSGGGGSDRGVQAGRAGEGGVGGGGMRNAAYDNSICRLYVLVHGLEDVFPLLQEGCASLSPLSEHHIALSILAQCPVVSLVASCSAVSCPISMQWDQALFSSFEWLSVHAPTPAHFPLLPDVLLKCQAAALAGKGGKARSAMALRYILRSLTRKHCDLLKNIIKLQERAAAAAGGGGASVGAGGNGGFGASSSSSSSGKSSDQAPELIGDSLFGALPTKPVAAVQAPQSRGSGPGAAGAGAGCVAPAGIKWSQLLAVCTTLMITKNDTELRKLIEELIDQRILKAHGDGQSMLVSLLLSTEEVLGALKYFEGKQ